jgi:uncharacterized membrane-anchored protein
MNGLTIEHYENVEDIICEALDALCGITDIRQGIDELEKDVEYACGAINIVKLGDKPNTLKHKHRGVWSEDVDQIGTNYMYATYYRADELQVLVEKHLTRKHYNNEFLKLD